MNPPHQSSSPKISSLPEIMQYDNKVAIITGGSNGIGKALAVALVQRGAKIVIGDIDDQEGAKVVAELNAGKSSKVAICTRCDVTSWEQNKALFELTAREFGGVDFVILNAGIAESTPTLVSNNEVDVFRTLEVNIGGVIKGTKLGLLYLKKRGGGSIINVASMAGLYPNSWVNLVIEFYSLQHLPTNWPLILSSHSSTSQLLADLCREQARRRRVHAKHGSHEAGLLIRVSPKHYFNPLMVVVERNSLSLLGCIIDTPRKVDPLLNRLMNNENFAPMETVVDAFIQFIENDKFSGDIVMCLPDGNRLVPKPKMPASTVSRAPREETAKVLSDMADRYQRILERAVEKAKL
ncbi:hypothetical protein BC936DRAFT_141862 [Jimgerdemannia flammicorona]|uniref:15-hydroxyprostaglandin dehydrogenase n=1 Tax=Jimgerdemannia flammicorona TaxID=994334 RepID=A0A433A1I1_9FUNG|nr:hypothetical protein BC936DRAFT_141862 [Jimgerdemannia flammicorona]